MRGWVVGATADLQGLAVTHGEYQVSVMLGKRLAGYVEHGARAGHPGPGLTPASTADPLNDAV